MSKQLVIFGVIILAAVGLVVFLSASPKTAKVDLVSFARCLAQKNVTMYGAYWCAHCQNQKASFGDSFRFVPYVECTQETQKCLAQKINGYPTWIFGDGRRFEGEQSLEKLSTESGCALNASTTTP